MIQISKAYIHEVVGRPTHAKYGEKVCSHEFFSKILSCSDISVSNFLLRKTEVCFFHEIMLLIILLFHVPRIAVAVGSLTANENFAKFFTKRKGAPLYFFFISKLLRLAFAVDRKPQACGCGRCCGCGRESRPQFGVW